MSWAKEIGALIDGGIEKECSEDEEWFSCEEQMAASEDSDLGDCRTPPRCKKSISDGTPPKRVVARDIALTELWIGTPLVPLQAREEAEATGRQLGAETKQAHAFGFLECWLCGNEGCKCTIRCRRKRQRRRRGIRAEAAESIAIQWEEVSISVRRAIQAEEG